MPLPLRIALEFLGGLALLFLLLFLFNYPKMRRLRKKAEAVGTATCKRCGYVGVLSLRSGAGGVISSSNFRLVCAACGGPDWFVTGDPPKEKSA
jgi:hypothetical protein